MFCHRGKPVYFEKNAAQEKKIKCGRPVWKNYDIRGDEGNFVNNLEVFCDVYVAFRNYHHFMQRIKNI